MTIAAAAAALAMYGAALLNQWGQLNLRHTEASELTADSNASRSATTRIYALSSAGVLCHAIACYSILFTGQGLNLSVLAVSNLVCFVMLLVVLAATARLPVQNLNLFLYPLAIVLLLALMLFGPGDAIINNIDQYLATHILLSLGAYAMLMMAAFQSGLLATQEKHLRNRSFGLLRILPPLEYMEQLLVVMLWVGLILLTCAIASGFIFLDLSQQVAHHFVLTTASWLTYVVFLGGRYLFGWRGLTAVRWTTTAFVLLLLGYLGSKFVLEYLLS